IRAARDLLQDVRNAVPAQADVEGLCAAQGYQWRGEWWDSLTRGATWWGDAFCRSKKGLNMKLEVKRQWFTTRSTVGELFIDGVHFCYTLEPPTRDDEIKPRAIPVGTYDVRIGWSPKHHRLIPMVGGVPGFSGVEIHIGNYPRDTEGC